MAKKTNIGSLTEEVMEILNSYEETIETIMLEEIRDVAETAKKDLKKKSPEKTGGYAKAWTYKVQNPRTTRVECVIYNKKYPLTHLLENGHANVTKGGRTVGWVKANPHIAEVNDYAQELYEAKLKVRISKGIDI